ncbi:MAG: hypothetical protein AAF389_07305 [Gemmatimonadota bacterium]
MNEPGNLPRVYGEKEIGQILQRATELQHQEPSAPAAGVTLSELEEIAVEAGIDPKFLRRAAVEIDAGVTDTSFWTKVVGDEMLLVREMTLRGEFADSGFERIVSTIQTHSREHGQPSLLGRTLTWRAETASKMRTIQITVASRDGETNIRLEENLTQMAVGTLSGMTAGLGLGAGLGVGTPIGMALGSVALATAAPIGILAMSYIGGRWLYRAQVRSRVRQIATLFERVVDEARSAIDANTVQPSSTPEALPPGR